MRNVGRSRREKDDVERAEEKLEDHLRDKKELEEELSKLPPMLRSRAR